MRTRTISRLVGVVLLGAPVASACGDDATTDASADSSVSANGTGGPAAEVQTVSGSGGARRDADARPTDVAAVVAADRALAGRLYADLVADPARGNVFFSPYSIAVALSMAAAGAEDRTAQELRALLGITDDDAWHGARNAVDLAVNEPAWVPEGFDPLRLGIANTVFGQVGFPFEDAFLSLLARDYGAGLQTVDFAADPDAARRGVNQWVAERTEDHITELLPPESIDELTRFVLVNAVFFQGAWVAEFDEQQTKAAPFALLDGSTVDTETMHGSVRTNYGVGDGWAAVRLRYWGGYSMVVLVPDDGRFADVEARVTAGLLDEVRAINGDFEVRLALPKFSFATDVNLVEVLERLGVVDAFDPRAANFSGIADVPPLYISGVFHQANVAVDEKGTVASAATAVVGQVASMPGRAELQVDRPFLVAIQHDDSGQLLFLGRVVDPTAH